MQQAARVTRHGSMEENLRIMISSLDILCGKPDSTYFDVLALPHLDHAEAEDEEHVWAEHIDDLATVFIDASLGDRSREQNIDLTAKQVEKYKKNIVIEAALQRPAVFGKHDAEEIESSDEQYAEEAREYVDKTGTDLLVVELGSTQQALGWADYNSKRAQTATRVLGESMLVVHGGSSIPLEKQGTLADDGVIRFNIWTRIAREGALAAAERIISDMDIIRSGDPDQVYFTRYRDAHFDKQVESMKAVLKAIGYERMAQ